MSEERIVVTLNEIQTTLKEHGSILTRHDITLTTVRATLKEHEAILTRHDMMLTDVRATLERHGSILTRHDAILGDLQDKVSDLCDNTVTKDEFVEFKDRVYRAFDEQMVLLKRLDEESTVRSESLNELTGRVDRHDQVISVIVTNCRDIPREGVQYH